MTGALRKILSDLAITDFDLLLNHLAQNYGLLGSQGISLWMYSTAGRVKLDIVQAQVSTFLAVYSPIREPVSKLLVLFFPEILHPFPSSKNLQG